MIPKILGAVLILTACGGMGISLAANHRQKEILLRQLITALEFMIAELQYRQTPLPQLMQMCGEETNGPVSKMFITMARELERQLVPDAASCMQLVTEQMPKLPDIVLERMLLLGRSLGRFDIVGQISGLQALSQLCRRDLDGLLVNREARLRGYMTLGLCAGIALVIIFI